MRTEYKNNRKHVICDNLSEFFEEFKRYRNKKSNICYERDYSKHVFPSLEWNKEASQGKDTWKLFLVDLDFEEPKTEPFWSLGLDISPASIKEVNLKSEWGQKERKIREILHEIWETGEIKNSQGLDLNWPVASKEENEPKKNSVSSPTEPSDKKSKIIWWIGGGIIFIVFVLLLIYLFRKRKSSR